LACLCISSFALTLSTATLTGRVTDPNAAAIVGAKVEANNIDTNLTFSTVTNSEGLFVIPNLPPGRYRIFVQKDGFTTITRPDVILHVQDIISLSFSMQPGSIIQSMTVEGGAPLIQKESATVGTVVDRQFVENLPLNGRSFQSLIALTPGVVLTKASFGEQGQFSVNGQRANANYFMVDGVSANAGISAGFSLVQSAGGALPAFGASGGTNSLVSVDAMQEFKIQTSTFAPEFGRTPGAQISIITRSGANDFRGTLFDYFRNDALDANDWFANSRRQPKPALRQNDFGGVLGGPIVKNKTFFFFSYEGLRLRLPQTRLSLVPSVASRQAAVPQMQPILNAFSVPNGRVFANGFAEFSASYTEPLNLNATSIRIDHTFNNKLTIFGRYNHSPSETTQRGISDVLGSLNSLFETKFKTQSMTIRATQIFTPTISNEIGANYSKSNGGSAFSIDEFGGAVLPPDSLIFPPFTTRQNAAVIILFADGRGLSFGKNVENTQRQLNLVDNLSVVTGAHQLKLGVDYRLLLPINSPGAYRQTVSFSNLTGTANALSGIAQNVLVSAVDTVPLSLTNFSVYGQDTWKATTRLTLTYGLRWDINPAPKGRNGKDLFTLDNIDDLAALRFAHQDLAALRLAPQGTPLYETTYGNLAPRIGVAYQLSQSQGREMILRGGFGIFYDLGSGSVGRAAAGFPYSRSSRLLNVPFPLNAALVAPPPFGLSPALGPVIVADPNLKLPRTYQWNLAVEQSLGTKQTFSASYIGAIGRSLLRSLTFTSPSLATSVSFTNNTATSDYHALQLQFQRRLSRRLQALASYTWSHSIDIASNDSASGSTPVAPRLDRGNSDFDVRHSFNTAVTYDIPAPALGAVAAPIFRNWSVDTIITARSATPVDIFARTDRSGGIQTSVRPNLIPNVPLYIDDPSAPGGRRFNDTPPLDAQVLAAGCVARTLTNAKGAFCTPPAGQQGNFGRNVLRLFPVFQTDLSLHRQFNLTERLKLQFRAEAFNLFNHPNFGDPGVNFDFANTLTSPLFGQSTQTLGRSLGSGGAIGGFNPLYQVGGPRSMQLALKLIF
jgi:hypothetical protein